MQFLYEKLYATTNGSSVIIVLGFLQVLASVLTRSISILYFICERPHGHRHRGKHGHFHGGKLIIQGVGILTKSFGIGGFLSPTVK